MIALTAIIYQQFKVFPFLIVCPSSTVLHWKREYEKWAPWLEVIPYGGTPEARQIIQEYEIGTEERADIQRTRRTSKLQGVKCHVVITTYEFAVQDASFLGNIDWEMIVVDEAQRLKNDESRLFLSLQTFTTQHKILLTGTPVCDTFAARF